MALRRRPGNRLEKKSGRPVERGRTRRSGDSRRQELNEAVRSGTIRVVAEPIVDVATHQMVGYEAVVRMPVDEPPTETADAETQNPRSKLLATRAMLAAVDDDHIVAMNRRLVEGIRPLVADRQIGLQDGLFVSVAVDARFVADDLFLETVKDSVRLAGLQADQLLLSIDAWPGFETLWSKLQRLKSHGARVAVHDFALGSTSTDLLRRYPLNVVRFALTGLGEPAEGDGSLLDGVVRLAENLGCETIADDVRSTAELERLRAVGCDAAHGFIQTPGP